MQDSNQHSDLSLIKCIFCKCYSTGICPVCICQMCLVNPIQSLHTQQCSHCQNVQVKKRICQLCHLRSTCYRCGKDLSEIQEKPCIYICEICHKEMFS